MGNLEPKTPFARPCLNYGSLQSDVLAKLFQSYCCSFYGCTIWKLYDVVDNQICTEWNKAVRRVLRLPTTAHRFLLGPLINQRHISDQFAIRFIKFFHRLRNCDNEIVKLMSYICMNNDHSTLKNNVRFIKWKYGFNVEIYYANVCRRLIEDKVKCSPEQNAIIDGLQEILQVRDGNMLIGGLDQNDVIEMIVLLSTCDIE